MRMKMRLKMKNISERYGINSLRPRHGHKYTKYKICLGIMMVSGKVKHELRVTSSNPRVASSNPRVTSSHPRVRRLKARVARLKTRVRRLKARVEAVKPRVK